MLKLYYCLGTCALASHVALEEAGAQYDAVRVSLAAGEQRKPEYLAINPKGRVPALITDQGALTETPAILMYISQTFPQAKLAPIDDPFALAQVQSFNSYLCSTVHVAHAHRTRPQRWADDETSLADMKRKVPQTVGECFDLIERQTIKGPWVMGDTYTIADPYLFTVSGWLEGDSVDITRYPKVNEHWRRMQERPAVQRALAMERA